MKVKVSFEDRTVSSVATYVKIDDVECEIDELIEVLSRLELMDIPLPKEIKNKLIKLQVVQKSKLHANWVRRGKNYDAFADKIEKLYKKNLKKSA
jgi:hypothetical protein